MTNPQTLDTLEKPHYRETFLDRQNPAETHTTRTHPNPQTHKPTNRHDNAGKETRMTYTPTTEEVRERYTVPQSEGEAMDPDVFYVVGEAFDRWLEAHDREVKAQALEEAANDGEIRDNGPWVEWWLRNRAQQLKEQQ